MIYATLSRKSPEEDRSLKYATPSRTSAAKEDKPNGSICQTSSGVSQASSVELSLADIARCFPLSWSAYVRLLGIKNELARKFYETEACAVAGLCGNLDRQINSSFAERTAPVSEKRPPCYTKEKKRFEDHVQPEEETKDPFVLEFRWALRTNTRKQTWKRHLSGIWRLFLLSWAMISVSSAGRNACASVTNGAVDLFFHRRLHRLVRSST